MDPSKVGLAVWAARHVSSGHATNRHRDRVGVAHHLCDARTGKELEGDHRRDRVAGQSKDWRSIHGPEGQGFCGLDRHLHPRHVADLGQDFLHIVEVAHRDPAAGHYSVARLRGANHGGSDLVFVIGNQSEVNSGCAHGVDQSEQRVAVRVMDLADAQWARPVEQLVAG